ncbi:MAG: hypothetical protein LBP30_04090, partial [Clostridiales Family XIII bacterium]|jgi:hypothetical protein|nr:hypothetical protein [Clostridiales Family XIII bacterium]
MCFFDLANGCFSFRSGRKIFQSHPETVAVTAWPNSAIGSFLAPLARLAFPRFAPQFCFVPRILSRSPHHTAAGQFAQGGACAVFGTWPGYKPNREVFVKWLK